MNTTSRLGKGLGRFVGLVLCIYCLKSSATTTTFTQKSDWLAAVDNVTVERFLEPFDQPAQFLSLGYTIDIGSVNTGCCNPGTASGDLAWRGGTQGAINVSFNTPGTTTPATVSAIMVIPGNEGVTRIRAFDLSNTELAFIDVNLSGFSNVDYAGFTSTEGIARLELNMITVGDAVIEDMYFGEPVSLVPEPTTFALALAALCAAISKRRIAAR